MPNSMLPDFEKFMSRIVDPLKIHFDVHRVLAERIALVASEAEKLRKGLDFIDDAYVRNNPDTARKIKVQLTREIGILTGRMKDTKISPEGVQTPKDIAIDIHNFTLRRSIDIYTDVIQCIDRVLGE